MRSFGYTLILKYNWFCGRYLYTSKFSSSNSKLVKWALKDITILFSQLWVCFLSKKKIQFLFTSKTLPFLPLRGKLAGLYPEPLSEVNTAKRDFFCYISDTVQEQENECLGKGKGVMMAFNWSFAFPEPVPKSLYYQKGSLYKLFFFKYQNEKKVAPPMKSFFAFSWKLALVCCLNAILKELMAKKSHLLKYCHTDCWPSVSQQAFQHSRRLYSPMNTNHQSHQKYL